MPRAVSSLLQNSASSWIVACCCALIVIAPARAEQEERLVDLPAFDQILMDADNNNALLKVEPLDFPNRKVSAQPEGNLTIRLLSDPTRPFEVPWANIQKVLLFEDFLMQEATRLSAEGKFDEAFDYYARLLREYPALPGLNEAANDYLRRNALELQKTGQYERALAVLASLYQRQPSAPGLGAVVDAVCGKMIEQHLRDKNYAAARAVLNMWREEFAALKSTNAAAWEQRFTTAATRQVSEARQFIAAKQYVAARKAMGRARDIWPENDEADALLAELQRESPTVSVGLFEASPRPPVRRIDDWASLRASRLVEPTISEIIGFGAEGGVYRSRYGEWVPDESGLRLTLQLNPPTAAGNGNAPSADEIARFLLNLADPTRPEYLPEFADVLAAVSVEGTNQVHLDWKRPHVRPESLLQLPLSKGESTGDGESTGNIEIGEVDAAPPWVAADAGPDANMFTATENAQPQSWLRTIIEQTMQDDQTAVEALVNGEIDVLDRVPPWQLSRLRSAPDIHVESYALPTVHVLVLNPARPLLQEREFRRALCFGIQRERIVKEVLAGGADIPGFTAVSGPFPAGLSFGDPLRYGYNNQIEPRPFEPRLATVLASVAWAKIQDPSGKGQVEPTPLPTLVLAHPADPVARVACATIQLQLAKAGIPIKLVEFTADELLAGKVVYDLRYAELAVWEPIADVSAILGPQGLAGSLSSHHLTTAIRELDDATNWKLVRAKFAEIHDIAHHDLPLIPLWQTVNFFAYRSGLQGIGESPVTLYQNVDAWRVGGEGSVARVQAKP